MIGLIPRDKISSTDVGAGRFGSGGSLGVGVRDRRSEGVSVSVPVRGGEGGDGVAGVDVLVLALRLWVLLG